MLDKIVVHSIIANVDCLLPNRCSFLANQSSEVSKLTLDLKESAEPVCSELWPKALGFAAEQGFTKVANASGVLE